MTDHLKLQGTIYSARLTIPVDVRHRFQGKKELVQSLKTGEKRIAKARAAALISVWKLQIASARNVPDSAPWSDMWAAEIVKAITLQKPNALTLPVNAGFLEKGAAAYEPRNTVRKIRLSQYRNEFLETYSTHPISTQKAYAGALAHFFDQFKHPEDVTPKSLRAWLKHLVEVKELGQETVGRALKRAHAFWDFLREHEYVQRESHPFTTDKLVLPRNVKKSQPIVPFTVSELNAIIASPRVTQDPELRLLVDLGRYTGARIEELAMLRKVDVNLEAGFITINGTKTDAAKREVPIHSALHSVLKEAMYDCSSEFVIPGFEIDSRGERGKALGKRFGRAKTELGHTSRSKCFHSIRKTVVTLLERAGVPEGITADIVGHEKDTITYGLYSGGSSMKQKVEALGHINYA